MDKKDDTPRNALAMKAGVDLSIFYKLIKSKHSDILLSTVFKLADELEVDVNEFGEKMERCLKSEFSI